MATNDSRTCKICQKAVGTMLCAGCKNYFCRVCIALHSNEIERMFDRNVIDQHDPIFEKLMTLKPTDIKTHPFVAKIDDWRTDMIKKVEQTAERTQQELIKILNEDYENVSSRFYKFSRNIRHLKDSKNYVETDIEELSQKLDQFRLDIEALATPINIRLNQEQTKEIKWDKLLFVETVINKKESIAAPKREFAGSGQFKDPGFFTSFMIFEDNSGYFYIRIPKAAFHLNLHVVISVQ